MRWPRGCRAGRRFPTCCCWSPAGTPASGRAPGSAPTASSAPAATTPPARPSTRPPSCWASAIPAARRSRRRARRRPAPVRAAAAAQGARRLRLLVFRAEDRGAADRRRTRAARAGAVADLAAAVEAGDLRHAADRTANAIAWFRRHYPAGRDAWSPPAGSPPTGGCAQRSPALAEAAGLDFVAPPPELCTDNGAMIAWAGLERLRLGLTDRLDAPVRPRWPLDKRRARRPTPPAARQGGSRVKRLAVIGGGAWGTALAEVAARAGARRVLWARDPAVVAADQRRRTKIRSICRASRSTRRSSRPPTWQRRSADAEAALIVVPAQFLRGVLAAAGAALAHRACRCCSAPRASRRNRCKTMSEVAAETGARLAARRAVGPELRGRGGARPADRGDDRQPRPGARRRLCRGARQRRVSGPIRRPTRSGSRSAARSRTCWRSPAASSRAAVSATTRAPR